MYVLILMSMGALLMYIFDPVSGGARRARLAGRLPGEGSVPHAEHHNGEPKSAVHTEAERRHREQQIDDSLEDSFPASDPVSPSPLKPDNESRVVPAGQSQR